MNIQTNTIGQMQNITPYIATICLGAMLFFSFVTAPLIFGKLPSRQAGLLIRAVFPWYYSILGAITAASVIAGVLIGSPGIAVSTVVLIGFALALFVLMPAINRARDRVLEGDAGAESRFRNLHLASVVVNAAQLCLLLYVSAGLLS